jgi:hypothetical protein
VILYEELLLEIPERRFECYNVMTVPVLLYRAESWTSAKQQINRTKTAGLHIQRELSEYRLIDEENEMKM